MGIKESKGRVDIVAYIGRTVKLRKEGRYYKGLCPFHSEKTPSFAVDPKRQQFKCFGCGKHGDVLDFIQFLSGKSLPEAQAVLENKSIVHALPPPPPPTSGKPKWELYTPCPQAGQITHRDFGKPNDMWLYRNQDGEGLYYICRFNLAGGKKEFRPLTWRTNGANSMWQWKGYPRPRPLYGLWKLPKMPKATVMVVEGEKTADAAQKLFPHVAVMTWHGGANAVNEHDWAPLAGRRVILCPDGDYTHTNADGSRKDWRDQPGNLAMLAVNEIIRESCPVVKWCGAMEETLCGWDWADFQGSAADALGYVRQNLADVADAASRFPLPIPRKPAEIDDGPVEKEIPLPPPPKNSQEDRLPFKPLGFESSEFGQFYWYLSYISQTILRLTATQVGNEHHIKEIADASYWEHMYPGKTKKLDTSSVAEMLRRECREVGMFDSAKIRGRGTWEDAGRILIHNGDHLIVNGKFVSLLEIKSDFAYQKKNALGIRLSAPLPTKQANKLVDICSLFAWERDVSAHLLAGWIVMAPFCGALAWRPHLWVIGGAGSGKSWILEQVVRPCLGRLCVAVQSKTTEPAIRQFLESDALPVVFDEFEAENETDTKRVQSIIDLARSASSSDSGGIAKGSSSGKAISYRTRSMFMFASISQSLTQYSDISRITTLSLKSSSDADKRKNAALVKENINEEFAQGLHSRTIRLLPVILRNIRVFSKAVAEYLGETRTGDQIGTMLAGAYSLYRKDEATPEAARAFIAAQDWSEEAIRDESKDEYRLLHAMVEHLTRFDAGKGSVERTIGELIFIALGLIIDDGAVTVDKAEERLAQIGVVSKEEAEGVFVYFSNNSGYIKKNVLRGTPWVSNFHKVLLRVEGTVMKNSVRFSPGIVTRAVGVPINLLNPADQVSDQGGQEEMPF